MRGLARYYWGLRGKRAGLKWMGKREIVGFFVFPEVRRSINWGCRLGG